jgi:hypothetical protein
MTDHDYLIKEGLLKAAEVYTNKPVLLTLRAMGGDKIFTDGERLVLMKRSKNGSWDAVVVKIEVDNGTFSIFHEDTLDHLDGWSWEDTEFYIELGGK